MIKKTLNNGLEIDVLGYGTYKLPAESTKNCILKALDVGYRRIDTASYYANEKQIGEAIKESGLKREELFLTTKLWMSDYGYTNVKEAFYKSMELLGVDYLDMYLLHWPYPKAIESYKAMEGLYSEGLIKSIGVCNFAEKYLKELLENTKITPAINQIELHPKLTQAELQEYTEEHNIVVEAWSPLIRGKVGKINEIKSIGSKYGKSPAQVTLRWHVQKGRLVIPKTATPERMEENFNIFDFNLTDDEISIIDAQNMYERQSIDPDVMYVDERWSNEKV